MRHWLPVLVLVAGLGSLISSAQSVQRKDPFLRYLAGVKRGSSEPKLRQFATECGVDVSKTLPRYAVGAGSSLDPVKSLSIGLKSLETDFYSTAEIWPAGKRVLIEIWANSDDVGSEVRYYKCFANRKLVQAEVIAWNLPLVKGPRSAAWGYSRRWVRGTNGRMKRIKVEFVDEMEQLVPKPTLDVDGEKGLHWIPPLGSLSELMLPPATLR